MSDGTKIEYADASWPIVAGCTHLSPGCDKCYAAQLTSGRLRHLPAYTGLAENGRFNGQVRCLPDRLDWPFHWKKPRHIFVSDMADLFHGGVPDGYIARAWDVMGRTPWHTYLIFTKRHARLRSWLTRWADKAGDSSNDKVTGIPPMPRGPEAVRTVYSSGRAQLFADMLDNMGTPPPGAAYPLYDWMEGQRWWPTVLPNVWVIVSVEDQHWAQIRIPVLLGTPAAVRGISAEPLLAPVDLIEGTYPAPPRRRLWAIPDPPERDYGDPVCQDHGAEQCTRCRFLDWVIVGGESGRGARPMELDWARQLVRQCEASRVPVYVKQLGAVRGKELGAGSKGGDWDAWPEDLRVRQLPKASIPAATG